MTIDDSILQYGLLLANAILLAAAALALVRGRAEARRLRALFDSPLAAALAPEPYDDRELRRMFDRRCSMLEKRLELLVERSSQAAQARPLAAVPPQKNELPVEYAVRMARNGASIDDLVRGCGLNKGEAQLLLRLHSRKPAQAAGLAH